jgi:hypothetical protein
MREKLKKFLAGLLGSGIMVLLFLGVFAVVALVGGNVMHLFGFRYDSVEQLLLYFLLGEVLGLPLDLLSTALPKVLYRMGKVNRRQGNFLYIPMDALFTMAAFWLADQWLDSVSTTGLSLCILGFGSALATLPIPKEA